MNARAIIESGREAEWERASTLGLLRLAAADCRALVRRFRDAAGAQAAAEALPRRRRDRHPDAPPRQPLFASRDLPAFDSQRPQQARADMDLPPLPRAPEPLSDAQIAQLVAAATARPVAVPPPSLSVPAPSAAQRAQGWERSLPHVATGELTTLAARFEQGAAGPFLSQPATSGTVDDTEAALAKALATLRSLATQGRAARPR